MTKVVTELEPLREWLDERGVQSVFVITGPERRFLDRLTPVLEGLRVDIFSGAAVHVPAEVVEDAKAKLRSASSDAIVTLGGGSATGLGKALRLSESIPFAAVATTYAGSEMTSIFGIARDGEKQTGRDPKVAPELVVHDASMTLDMPRRLSVTSLMNALAHPLSALSTGQLSESQRGDALDAASAILGALQTLVAKPQHALARRQALEGARAAALVLESGTLGEHHQVAHHFGGRLGADHASLHACLLPHTLAVLLRSEPDLAAALEERTRLRNIPGLLHAMLLRVGAPIALRSFGDAGAAKAACEELAGLGLSAETLAAAADALLGRDPSLELARIDLGLPLAASVFGRSDAAARVVVAVHGRGASAESILRQARAIVGDDPRTVIVAPQAPDASWYPGSYGADPSEHRAEIDAAFAATNRCVDWAAERVGRDNVTLLGFSQGACLVLEWLAGQSQGVGAVIALSGARLGPAKGASSVQGGAMGVPVLLGLAEGDPWVEMADVDRSAADFEAAGAIVTVLKAPPGPHAIRPLERVVARDIVLGPRPGPSGFGNHHHSESLPGAVPPDQNSPRQAPYGLWPEQINGTGFVAHRHQNLRSWAYRVRPAAQHTPFEPLPHPTLVADFSGPQDPNLAGWPAPPIPEAPTDFVDGLITLGGAGSAELRRGFAVHLYAANRSMDDRAHYNADSDLLIIPETGELVLMTDFGVLELGPGRVALVPRGVRFSVLLRDSAARGYVGEVFGRHFELPERGPVGANGLSDARHFHAPPSWHEDRLAPGFRVTAQYAGELFEATQDYSPFDVAGWHGNYAPYVYDLMHFSPAGNTRFDHGDPSVFTVLSAPLDEPGSHLLDFVFFPPRWDVSEHTFRPPYFHRNATTEINGIIADPSLGEGSPFETGGVFLTPTMTAHGVVADSITRYLARTSDGAEPPFRVAQQSMWFQFESALPMRLSAWARDAKNRRNDWTDIWGVYRAEYRPHDEP